MHVPAALWECWAPRYWCSYQRRCVNAGPEGRQKSGHFRWATNPRTGGPRDGRLCQVSPWYFLTRLVPPNRSHRSSAWCRRIWHYPGVACLQLCSVLGRCYFRLLFFLLPLLFFSPRFSFLCSLNVAPRSGRIFHFGILGPIIRGHLHGPVFDVDYLDHGPPRGRAAALRIWPRSTLRACAFSLTLAT